MNDERLTEVVLHLPSWLYNKIDKDKGSLASYDFIIEIIKEWYESK